MAKSWDTTLKRLVHTDPAAFVQWLLPEASFIAEYPVEIASLKREVDVLHEVIVHEQRMVLHIEFQTYNDATMARRLMMYNVLLMDAYQLPVLTCVIYLLQDGTVQPSPLRISVPSGHLIHVFYFESIEIGRLSAEDITNLRSETLLALVPLTQDGTEQTVLEHLFEELGKQKEPSQATEIEVIAFTLAAFALQRKNKTVDLEWLIRRFREMHDIIQDSPIFQEILREGWEKGMEKGIEQGRELGLEQGLEQGRLEATRRILHIVTEKRFPALVALVQEQAAHTQTLDEIDSLIVAISSAQNELEAYNLLRGYK